MLARLDSSEASFTDLQRPPDSVFFGGLSYVPIRRERESSLVSLPHLIRTPVLLG